MGTYKCTVSGRRNTHYFLYFSVHSYSGSWGGGGGAGSAKREARDAQILTCSRSDSQTLA